MPIGNKDSGIIHGGSDGGVAGSHAETVPFSFLVAPATANEGNSIHLRIIPVACWRVEDIRFAFDSSFVNSDVTTELRLLVSLRETHKKENGISGEIQYPPLSVFGHADPVGSDDYNKSLSGRRATAVYALLISNSEPSTAVNLWRRIWQAEHWGASQRQAMQSATNLPAGVSDGDLIKAYLHAICPPELRLTPKDFLAQGADSSGKGDYQGCSEFNPVLIFSRKEEAGFKESGDKSARNLANAPNRRVMVLLFRPGSQVVPSRWPCPRANEGTTGCIKRFWSDGARRRGTQLETDERRYADTHDTFACRFYDRLTSGSPCERFTPGLGVLFMQIFDGEGETLQAGKKYVIKRRTSGDTAFQGTLDSEAILRHESVPPDTYVLAVDGMEECPAIMLDFADSQPQVRFLSEARADGQQ